MVVNCNICKLQLQNELMLPVMFNFFTSFVDRQFITILFYLVKFLNVSLVHKFCYTDKMYYIHSSHLLYCLSQVLWMHKFSYFNFKFKICVRELWCHNRVLSSSFLNIFYNELIGKFCFFFWLSRKLCWAHHFWMGPLIHYLCQELYPWI